MLMKQYKAVIYDIDGTLLNTLDMNLYPLLRIIREEKGEIWTLEQVLPFYAQPGLKTMEDLGIRDIETTYARWVAYVNAYEKGAQPYEDMETVLRAFREAGMRQAIVSSKMKGQYQMDIVDRGWDRYMETAVLAEDTQTHKPNPEPLLECLRRMDLKAEDAVYIGDARSDCQAAHNAGMDFGFAKWGNILPVELADAEYSFAKPMELLCLLDTQEGQGRAVQV